MTTAISVRGLSAQLGRRTVLHDVDLDVEYGAVLALVGPNGAGKSTLLGALAGDIEPAAGDVSLDGTPIRQLSHADRARKRAVLLQQHTVSFPFTVRQIVEMGRSPWPADPGIDATLVDDALEAVEAKHLEARPFSKLSGGERARASLARVLAQDTPIVLLDEPTAALDLRHQEDVLRLARQLAYDGRAVVVVVHDLGLAAAYADTVAVVDNGAIVACGAPREVLTHEAILRTWHQEVHVLSDPDGNPVVVPRRQISSKQADNNKRREAIMSITSTASSASLATRMREGSQAEHTAAEGSTFMSALLDLRVNERGYAEYLARFLRVYEALETVGRRLVDDPVVGPLIDPALNRYDAIRADLAFWSQLGGLTELPSGESRATDAYVARILETEREPELYVAHHYTRYLGDLSGGQAIGQKLAREFGLADGKGVEFYEFPAIHKPKPYKDSYRATLDALPVDETQGERIVDEVRRVFNLNGAVFAELTEDLPSYLR